MSNAEKLKSGAERPLLGAGRGQGPESSKTVVVCGDKLVAEEKTVVVCGDKLVAEEKTVVVCGDKLVEGDKTVVVCGEQPVEGKKLRSGKICLEENSLSSQSRINESVSGSDTEEMSKAVTTDNVDGRSEGMQSEKRVTHGGIMCILERNNFEDWLISLKYELGREGLKKLLVESDDEKKFAAMSEDDRMVKMDQYDRMQDTAFSIMLERLPCSFRSRIRNCSTIRQAVEKLKDELRVTSNIGMLAARRAYFDLRYRQGDDMRRYISLHESKAQEYFEAGGKKDEDEMVLQLHQSMPPAYDSALTLYSISSDDKSYDKYRRCLLDVYERIKWAEDATSVGKNLRIEPSNSKNESSTTERSEKTCYYCKVAGHIAKNCPKVQMRNALLLEAEQSRSKNVEKVDESDPKSNGGSKPPVPDWTKFKSYNKSIANI